MKCLFLLLAHFLGGIYASAQYVNVTGWLVCHRKDYDQKATVILYELDDWEPHDMLNRTTTSDFFHLVGMENEWGSIETFVKIIDFCLVEEDGKPCQRTFKLYVPKDRISKNSEKVPVFDFGQIDLTKKHSKETGGCQEPKEITTTKLQLNSPTATVRTTTAKPTTTTTVVFDEY